MPARSDTFDPAIQSENIAYSRDELITCDRCARPNAPNRLECIYCGAILNVDPDSLDKVSARPLESWEPGTSVVLTGGNGDSAEAAELSNIDDQQFTAVAASGMPLPIGRYE